MKDEVWGFGIMIFIAGLVIIFGIKWLSLPGFVFLIVGLVAGIVALVFAKKKSSSNLKMAGFALMALSVVGSFAIKSYTISIQEQSTEGSIISSSRDDDSSTRDRTLEGMDSDSQQRYDSMNSRQQDYVDDQMKRYDELCARSSDC